MEFLPFYFVFFIISIAGAIDHSSRTCVITNVRFWLILLSLVSLASFRSVGVGSDDEAYVEILSKIPSIIDCKDILCGYDYSNIQIEFGFYSFLSILSIFGGGYFLMFFSTAFLSVYLNLKAINIYSPLMGASSLIYFSHFFLAKELNAIRTGLATAIIFYATTYLQKKQYLPFAALLILAVSIHVSAILILVPVTLFILSPGRRQLVTIGAATLIIGSVLNLTAVIDLMLVFSFLQEKIELYRNAQEYNYAIPLLDLVNIRNIFIVSMCLIFWEKLCIFNVNFKFAFYFFFSATFIRIFLGDFAILAGRSYAAISMFEYIIIPILFIFLAGKKVGYFFILIYALSTLLLNLFVNTGWGGGVKYIQNIL